MAKSKPEVLPLVPVPTVTAPTTSMWKNSFEPVNGSAPANGGAR